MRRRSALHWLLIALTIGVAISQEADPCKRQPFRGRCPATGSGQQQRSQFVLRYYLRNGECVSYPYGHCANDENEPKLFRYKEECEDTCIGHPSEEVETTVSQGGQTYATVSPGEESTSVASSTQTECQKQREQRGSSRIRGGFVPECTSDGKFRPLQCEPDGLSCFCVSNDGIEIPNSRATLPDQPKPNCDQLDKSRPATTNEPQSLSESETCLGGSAPLQASNGQPVDCSRNECPVGYKCSVGARRSVCCKDDQKGDKNAEALYSGQVPEFCLLPKERGPGDRYELRFYYNKERQSCHYFFYGGNSGNSNNFATIEQCMATCNAGPATKALSSTETTPTSKNEVPQTTSSVVETSRIETTAVWSTAGTTPPEAEDTEESEATSPVATSTVTETTTTEAMSRTSATEETTPESLVRFTDSTSGPSNAVDNDDMTESESTTKTTDAFSERQEQTEESTASVEVAQTSQPTESSSESVETRTEQPRPSIRTSQQTISPPAHTRVNSQTLQTRPTARTTSEPTTTTPALPEDRCLHPLDTGSCAGHFDRWVWNAEKRLCIQFTYSGCGGNGNNWSTREECMATCSLKVESPVATTPNLSLSPCQSPIDLGDCGGSFIRYAYDQETNGNSNNFGSMADCERRCQAQGSSNQTQTTTTLSPNVCEHPIDKGECTGSFERFAYDTSTKKCIVLPYSGCGGNGNNFASIDICMSTCNVKVECAPAPTECDLSHCQLVNDSNGCSFCSCPPAVPPSPTFIRPRLPVPPANCPPLDVNLCVEPCIIFSNRQGCQECVCPMIQPSHGSPSRPESPVAPPAPLPSLSIDTPRINSRPSPPSAPSPPGVALPPSPERIPKKPALTPVARSGQNVVPNPQDVPAPPTVDQHKEFPSSAPEPQFPNLGDKCTQPVDPGPCKNFVERWYFNPARGRCEPFRYGGCAGNRNHFYTSMECGIHCTHFRTVMSSSESAQTPFESAQQEMGSSSSASNEVAVPTIQEQRPRKFQLVPRVEQPSQEQSRIAFAPSPQELPIQSNFIPVDKTELTVEVPHSEQVRQPSAPVPTSQQNWRQSNAQAPAPHRPSSPPVEQPNFEPVDVPSTPDEFETFEPEMPIGRQPQRPPLPNRESKPNDNTFVAPAPNSVIPSRFAHAQTRLPSQFISTQDSQQPNENLTNQRFQQTAQTNSQQVAQANHQQFIQRKLAQTEQKPQSQIFEIDRDVVRPTDNVFSVDDDVAHHQRPQSPPAVPVQRQFIVGQRPTQTFDAINEELVGASRDTTHVDQSADLPPSFSPKQINKVGVQREQLVANPWAGNQPHLPQTQQPTSGNLNDRYIPPNPPVRPEPVYQRPLQPAPFDVNKQYIPPAPVTIPTTNGNEATVPSTQRPIISRPQSHTYPPNLEANYSNRRREPLPVPSPELRLDLGNFAIAKPHPPASNPLSIATTKKPGPASIAFKALEQEEDSAVDIEDESTTTTAQSSTTQPLITRLPILPLPKATNSPHSVDIAVQVSTDEDKSAKSQRLVELPHSVAIPGQEFPDDKSAESQEKVKLPNSAAIPVQEFSDDQSEESSSDTMKLTVVAAKTTNMSTLNEKVEPKASGAKIQSVKEDEKLAFKKIEKTEAPTEVSHSTETTSEERPNNITSTSPATIETTTKKLEAQPTTTSESISSTVSSTISSTSNVPSSSEKLETTNSAVSTTQSSTTQSTTTEATTVTESSTQLSTTVKSISTVVPETKTSETTSSSSTTESKTTTEQQNTDAVSQIHADTEGEVSVANTDDADLLVDSTAGTIGATVTNKSASVLPPRANSAQTAEVAHPPSASSVNKLAANIGTDSVESTAKTYNASPLPKEQPSAEHLPIIAPSPKATIDYVSGKRLVDTEPSRAFGLPNAPVDINNPNFVDPHFSELDKSYEEQKIPVCPNGLKAMHYSDGRPIMCLPGKNQCPDTSVCYFNGLDFYCCPNEDDPYDQHIFGGYDGEEVKHGYKNRTDNLSIRSTNTLSEKRRARHRRDVTSSEAFARRPLPPTSFSLDHVTNSLRFDDSRPTQRISQSSRISPCTLPIPKSGDCESPHLRYFYDIQKDECRVFLRCERANENQFSSREECERRCKLGQILTARPRPTSTTTEKPSLNGHCPNGKMPLGDNAPVLCGNQTDSIGCPPGYFCRVGPPDVCCPEDVKFDLGSVLSAPRNEIRRKPFVSKFDQSVEKQNRDKSTELFIDDSAFDISVGAPAPKTTTEEATTTTTTPLPWDLPANLCPDGSDALLNSAGEIVDCGSGFDGKSMCPRGFYCSIDRERDSRLCCKLDIQSSNIPNPAPVIAPYLGVRRTNPGEAIDRPSLPSDERMNVFHRVHRMH